MKNLDDADVGTIAREIYVEAAPETVFDVISRPEHVASWWPDTASYDVEVGATGEITFGTGDDAKVVTLTVMEVDRPRTFSFRWDHERDIEAADGNSLFVTFALTPSGTGTLVRFAETGFREMGWSDAVVATTYDDHVSGWNHFLARLAPYAERVAS